MDGFMAEAARSSVPRANLARNDGEGLHRSSMEGSGNWCYLKKKEGERYSEKHNGKGKKREGEGDGRSDRGRLKAAHTS